MASWQWRLRLLAGLLVALAEGLLVGSALAGPPAAGDGVDRATDTAVTVEGEPHDIRVTPTSSTAGSASDDSPIRGVTVVTT